MKQIVALFVVLGFHPIFALNPSFSLKLKEESKVSFNVSSNLPSDTELLCTLAAEVGSYFAQDKVTVTRGEFTAGPFSNKREDVADGNYTLRIHSGLPGSQPSSVQGAMGKNGVNLEGSNVKVVYSNNTIYAEIKVEIKDGEILRELPAKGRGMAGAKQVVLPDLKIVDGVPAKVESELGLWKDTFYPPYSHYVQIVTLTEESVIVSKVMISDGSNSSEVWKKDGEIISNPEHKYDVYRLKGNKLISEDTESDEHYVPKRIR